MWDTILMRGKFYTTSESAWGAMLTAIVVAKESIYLEMYIFDGDTKGYDFLTELEIKARAGLRVIVILDALGSFGLANESIERLKSAGAEVRLFSYWLRRTHRKILIIDEWVVFLGGVNISKQFARWRDLQVRVSGRMAKIAVRSFAHIYRECGGKNPALTFTKEIKLWSRARTWFIESGVHEKFRVLRMHYEEHIDGAVDNIILVTPYLVPHPWMVAHLHRAVMRGINVTIIIPTITDYTFIDRLNYYYASQFEKIGVHCLLGTGMNHAKVMLVDDRIGTMGSQNIDTLSFDWNVESGIFFEDKRMVAELKKIVSLWQREALPFPKESYIPKWYDILLAYFLHLFQRAP